MRKLRLALVLPIIQVAIAAILLQAAYRTRLPRGSDAIPDVRLICRGLNAPALVFRLPNLMAPEATWIPKLPSVFGFDVDDVYFLVGVVVVWYLLGRALDQRRSSRKEGGSKKATAFVVYPLLLALGGLLFYGGLKDFGNPRSPNLGSPVGAFLTLMWSVGLIVLSGRRLVRAIRPAFRGPI
jgi:hypothetical protein